MKTIKVRPAAGLTVLDPKTRAPLPVEGQDVPRSRYWLRRLADGDVALVETPAPRSQPRTQPQKDGDK